MVFSMEVLQQTSGAPLSIHAVEHGPEAIQNGLSPQQPTDYQGFLWGEGMLLLTGLSGMPVS
jgi:hypothetical protein